MCKHSTIPCLQIGLSAPEHCDNITNSKDTSWFWQGNMRCLSPNTICPQWLYIYCVQNVIFIFRLSGSSKIEDFFNACKFTPCIYCRVLHAMVTINISWRKFYTPFFFKFTLLRAPAADNCRTWIYMHH